MATTPTILWHGIFQELLSNASAETQKLLLRKKADWAQHSNDQRLVGIDIGRQEWSKFQIFKILCISRRIVFFLISCFHFDHLLVLIDFFTLILLSSSLPLQMASVPELLMASGDYDKGIRLMMANGWVDR